MNARIEPSLLGRMSERRVLRVLQAAGPLSRAEVARRTGLSAPAVSRAVASLLRSGMIEQSALPHPTGGRPAVALRLATANAQVLGITIDADVCLAVSAALDGRIHGEPVAFDTPATYPDLLDAIVRHARELTRPDVVTLGVGLGLPGLVDYRSQTSVLSPNLPCTDGHTPARDLAERLGVECIMLQESHALCLAEQAEGQARGLSDFAMLDVHTGVGLGVVSGGRLLTGHRGMAGEVGHITVVPDGRPCGCGNRGCLETVANDSSLARRVSRRLERTVTIDEVIELARGGMDLSAELDDVCRYLAIGIAAVLNLFNPARLFIHGRLFDVEDGLLARTIERVKARTLRPTYDDCRIVRAAARKHQGAVAGIVRHLTDSVAPALEAPTVSFPEVRHAIVSP